MSALALWVTVGAIVALYSIFVDFKWSRINKITMYRRYCERGDLPLSASEFYSCYYPIEATVFTLLGPAATFAFFGKCRSVTKESRKLSTRN